MSRLDLLSQTTARLVETAASRVAPPHSEPQDGGGSTGEWTGFDALLEGLSKDGRKDGTGVFRQEEVLLDGVSGEENIAGPHENSVLEALLPDPNSAAGSRDTATSQSGSPVYSLLENLLPKILDPAVSGRGSGTEQNGKSLLPPSLLMPQDEASAGNLNPALGSRLPVSVQSQETHFRPVVENFDTVLADPNLPPTSENLHPASKNGFIKTPKDTVAGSTDFLEQNAISGTAPVEEADALTSEQGMERRSVGDGLAERNVDRVEVQKSSPAGARGDGSALPPATLHHLARAILKDVAEAAEVHPASVQGDSLHRVTVARASGGVLRVLNLQLNPAELGVVTIRMKLAGDGLEMELHAEREETAELLRNDAEKLSGLLKASGYRPDVISIQSTEASAHDRHAFQRSHQGQQLQGQDFQQGAAAGQGGSSQQRNEQYARSGAELRKDTKDDRSVDRNASAGIYL